MAADATRVVLGKGIAEGWYCQPVPGILFGGPIFWLEEEIFWQRLVP